MNKGIIFDFDGVIVASVRGLFEIYNEVKIELGIKDKNEDLTCLNGLTIKQICLHLNEKYKLNKMQEEIQSIYDNKLVSLYSVCETNKNVLNLIRMLKLKNIPMSIGSSCPSKYIDIVLGRLGITDYFECVISGDDISYGKPNPEVFIKCIGLSSFDSALVIDDSNSGVLAALAADCLIVKFDKRMSKLQNLEVIMIHFDSEISYLGCDDSLVIESVKDKYELDEIERSKWNEIVNNGDYNLPLLFINPVDIKILNKLFCYQRDYRYLRVKMNEEEVSVAVTGVVSNIQGDIILGRRSLSTYQYKNRIDMVPAGGLEDGNIIDQLNSEWSEETSSKEHVLWMEPRMLYLSKADRVLDVVVNGKVNDILENDYYSDEFIDFTWTNPSEAASLNTTPLTKILLELEASQL